jgi:hypothetical protein
MSVTLKRSLGEGGALIGDSHGDNNLYDVLWGLATAQNVLIAAFNIHTHAADGSEAGAYNTSKPQTDAEDISQGTPVAAAAQIIIE